MLCLTLKTFFPTTDSPTLVVTGQRKLGFIVDHHIVISFKVTNRQKFSLKFLRELSQKSVTEFLHKAHSIHLYSFTIQISENNLTSSLPSNKHFLFIKEILAIILCGVIKSWQRGMYLSTEGGNPFHQIFNAHPLLFNRYLYLTLSCNTKTKQNRFRINLRRNQKLQSASKGFFNVRNLGNESLVLYLDFCFIRLLEKSVPFGNRNWKKNCRTMDKGSNNISQEEIFVHFVYPQLVLGNLQSV